VINVKVGILHQNKIFNMILIILYLIGVLITGEILYLMNKYYPTIYISDFHILGSFISAIYLINKYEIEIKECIKKEREIL
jgi:ethanolamine transporter EutH